MTAARRSRRRWCRPLHDGAEVSDGHVERKEEAGDGRPADVALPVLDLGDVRVESVGPSAKLLLRQSSLFAQLAERSAESVLCVFDGVFRSVVHRPTAGRITSRPRQVVDSRTDHTSWRPR
jgi:hypothetical protein